MQGAASAVAEETTTTAISAPTKIRRSSLAQECLVTTANLRCSSSLSDQRSRSKGGYDLAPDESWLDSSWRAI